MLYVYRTFFFYWILPAKLPSVGNRTQPGSCPKWLCRPDWCQLEVLKAPSAKNATCTDYSFNQHHVYFNLFQMLPSFQKKKNIKVDSPTSWASWIDALCHLYPYSVALIPLTFTILRIIVYHQTCHFFYHQNCNVLLCNLTFFDIFTIFWQHNLPSVDMFTISFTIVYHLFYHLFTICLPSFAIFYR